MKAKIVLKSFPGHAGIPGHQGGSLPKNAGTSADTKSGTADSKHSIKRIRDALIAGVVHKFSIRYDANSDLYTIHNWPSALNPKVSDAYAMTRQELYDYVATNFPMTESDYVETYESGIKYHNSPTLGKP